MDKSVDGSRCFNISATALNSVRGIEDPLKIGICSRHIRGTRVSTNDSVTAGGLIAD